MNHNSTSEISSKVTACTLLNQAKAFVQGPQVLLDVHHLWTPDDKHPVHICSHHMVPLPQALITDFTIIYQINAMQLDLGEALFPKLHEYIDAHQLLAILCKLRKIKRPLPS